MKHSEITDLLGAYALDAVDGDERAVIEDHLLTCPRCRAEVQDHREAASMLAFAGGSAPEGVWDRIAADLDEPPPGLRLAPVAALDAPRRRTVPRVAAAALAAAAAIVLVLGVQVREQDQRIDELQTALQDPLVPALRAALADPDAMVLELASADGQLVLEGAITPDGVGYLRAEPLPDLGADRTYQLWGGAGDRLISLGVLGSDPEVVTFRAEHYTAFAVTEELAPGVVTTANTPIVAGSLA